MSVLNDTLKLEVRFAETIHAMNDRKAINQDQRDALLDLIEHMDEYNPEEFESECRRILGVSR